LFCDRSAGLGRVLLIPSEFIDSFTTIITTLFLLWGKSPRLLLLCVAADVCTTRLNNRFYSIVRWLNGLFGLDKTTWKGWIEMRSVEQALSNFEDMRINAKEYDIEKSVVKASEISERDDLRSSVVGNMMAPFRDMLNDVPTLVTAFFGGTFALAGSISAADLTNFTFQISSLVNKATRFRGELESLWKMEDHRFTYGLSLMDLLDQKPKMGIDGGWKPTNTNDGLHGDIEFKNVSFRYKGMPKNMLKNISYTIPEGSFVGICGERGAGKSTMYKLIMRLYDPNEGEILIGGHPLEYYNSVWLRSNIGISVQKPAIMRYKSLKENVIYGSESKFRKLGMGPIEIEKHIQHVLEKANIWEHFQDKEKFPQGLATKCYNLSGGETRSVGTARALLKDPSILLLDEPTEGLDAENEGKLVHCNHGGSSARVCTKHLFSFLFFCFFCFFFL
jgi:ABC-type multidrug transport system fused ATPase/permease subunit